MNEQDVTVDEGQYIPTSWIGDGEPVYIRTVDGEEYSGARIAMPVSFRNKMVMLYDDDTDFVRVFIPMTSVVEIRRLVEKS